MYRHLLDILIYDPAVQKLIIGTYTAENEKNNLLLAQVRLPRNNWKVATPFLLSSNPSRSIIVVAKNDSAALPSNIRQDGTHRNLRRQNSASQAGDKTVAGTVFVLAGTRAAM
nr:hypothetical protein Iba_chr12aCG12850 [Ipomoea batatas]GME04961.1 hypothetical protein Iba_scaffold2413CG0010 [Ipomoea batatas]